MILLLPACQSDPAGNQQSAPADTLKNITLPQTHDYLFFDNQRPFEIINFTNSINRNITHEDTSRCNSWVLNKFQIAAIIRNCEPIEGTTWDLSFAVFSCSKSVTVLQENKQYNIELNAGSYFTVSDGDSSAIFGDYKKEDRKYFWAAPNEE